MAEQSSPVDGAVPAEAGTVEVDQVIWESADPADPRRRS